MARLASSRVWMIGVALAATAFAPGTLVVAQEELHPTVTHNSEQSTDVKEGTALFAKQLQSRGWDQRAAQKSGG